MGLGAHRNNLKTFGTLTHPRVGTICFSISATNCNQYVSRSTSRYLLFIGLGFRKTAKIFLENVGIGSR